MATMKNAVERKKSNTEKRYTSNKAESRKREINKRKGTSLGNASKNVIIEPHPKFDGVFIGRGKEDMLLTKNMVPGSSVYGEKRVCVSLPDKRLNIEFGTVIDRSWLLE